MDSRTKLHVLYDNTVDVVDYSKEAQDFKRDTFTITPLTTDHVYIGFRKIINAVYIHTPVPNVNPTTLDFEYYTENDTWETLTVSDDTCAITRNGFITWQRPSDAKDVAVDGITACWVRFQPQDDMSATEIQAVNIVFSDDNDICSEVPALIDTCFYQQGQTSHILNHVASRNYIMSRLRSLGYVKQTTDGQENINEWDVLDVYELRQASMYYAIAQIYFNLSDDIEDQYWIKYKEYKDKFDEAMSLGQLRIDLDDDGQVDAVEKRPAKSIRWSR